MTGHCANSRLHLRVNWSECSLDDGVEQGMAALHEGIRILDEDEQQRTTMWNDENVVEPDIDDEASQEEEEEQQEEDQSLADRGRRRKTTTTQTLGESERRSSPPPPTRPTPRTSETIGESSRRSPSPPLTRPSSYGYSPLPAPTQSNAHMFLPMTPSMSVHPYHFDPYALGHHLRTWTIECLHIQCMVHCLNTCQVHLLRHIITTIFHIVEMAHSDPY
ncbi:hypothetical protein Sjap_021300 [Stephania japonica]|uniref:Uncharacterized protein n=1 Tax=Stephania japonica TaxID=461633 RepID=A0AAP0HNW9_9MAGN